jgi:lipopolysaccharide heptosyltransferase II
MGDIILTLPVMEALKKEYPDSEIFFICKKKYKDLLLDHPQIDKVIEFDALGDHKSITGLLRLINELKTLKFDLILDLHSNLRSFLIRNLVPAEIKIKYNKRWLARLLMVYFKLFRIKSKHTLDCYMESLQKLGIKSRSKTLKFYLNGKDKAWANKFLSENGLNQERILLGMAPGARWNTKKWNKEKFAKVAETLSQKFPMNVILFGDKNDTDTILWIDEELSRKRKSKGNSKIIQAVDLPFKKVAGVLQLCDILVTNDSGLMHLASFLKIPVIAIFGPTHPDLGFSPLGQDSLVITVNEKCSPCSLHGKRKCHKKEKYCMDRILPEQVAEKASEFLNRQKAIFLDRDGTLIQDKNFISKVEDVEFIPGSIKAVKIFKDMGYKVVIVSNQSGIGRGILTREIVDKINEYMLDQLKKDNLDIDGVYYCPHIPDDNCECRKPNLKMVNQASSRLNLNLKNSWAIGDKLSDVMLGQNMGGKGVLVLTGFGKRELQKIKDKSNIKPDFVVENLLEAAVLIQKDCQKRTENYVKQDS